jgi:bacteriocin biosynthesis cyclodehydratase domain-containing protein
LLPAALRPVWRSHQALQIGLDPDRAVVVDGIDEPTAKALLGLDGTRTEDEVLANAAESGLDADLVGGLLADLRAAGILAEIIPRSPAAPTGPLPAGPSATSASTVRPAAVGPSAAGASAVGPTAAGASGAASSAAGLCGAGSSATGRAGATPSRVAPFPARGAGARPSAAGSAGAGPVWVGDGGWHGPVAAWGGAFGAVGAAGRLGPDLAALSLVPAPRSPLEVIRGRRAATVVVHGAGRVGVSLAALLAAAGVGRVHVADRGPVRPGDVAPAGAAAADIDRSRSGAAAEALRRAAPEVQTAAPAPGRRPDLVVLASTEPVDTMLRTALAGGRVPHLVAGVREITAVVGPLVLPGRTGCLHCGDLHRADRDPAWPVVAAQLVGIRRRREEPCDVALATLAASLAAVQALAHLDGRPAAATGASLELSLTDWRLRRRTWPAHPRCDCGAAA